MFGEIISPLTNSMGGFPLYPISWTAKKPCDSKVQETSRPVSRLGRLDQFSCDRVISDTFLSFYLQPPSKESFVHKRTIFDSGPLSFSDR